jgi:transposase, IS30 family
LAGGWGARRPAVSREVARNGCRGVYRALAAQAQADARAGRPKVAKLARNSELRGWVQDKLADNWSPEQVSAMLAGEFPDRPEMRVSHETIYQAVYVQGRGALRRELAARLRTGRALRKPRRTEGERRGKIPGMVMISQRPAEAADRAVPGHWEGDLERHEAPCNRAEVKGLRRCAVAAA